MVIHGFVIKGVEGGQVILGGKYLVTKIIPFPEKIVSASGGFSHVLFVSGFFQSICILFIFEKKRESFMEWEKRTTKYFMMPLQLKIKSLYFL